MNLIWVLLWVATISGGYYWLAISRAWRVFRHAHSEYWVFVREPKIPDQSLLLDAMVGNNPYTKRGQNPIGPLEGLVLSDIRLKISLVLRSKNPQLFDPKPYLINQDWHLEFSEFLDSAEALVKLQFSSQSPLKSKAHLQFLLHACDAILRTCEGEGYVWDTVSERLWNREQLKKALSAQLESSSFENHVELGATEDHSIMTRGLRKIGFADIVTAPFPPDQVSLGREIIEQFARRVWEGGRSKEELSEPVTLHSDDFLLHLKPQKMMYFVRVLRKQVKA